MRTYIDTVLVTVILVLGVHGGAAAQRPSEGLLGATVVHIGGAVDPGG